MPTEHTRNEIWQDLLDTARLIRYYDALADQYRYKQMVLRFVLLTAATSSMATLFDLLPSILTLGANGVIAAGVMWDFMQDYSTKTAVLHAISSDCRGLEVEWQTLWNEQAYLEDREVLHRITQLSHQLNVITGRAGAIGVRENAALNEQCATDAYQVMQDRYAV